MFEKKKIRAKATFELITMEGKGAKGKVLLDVMYLKSLICASDGTCLPVWVPPQEVLALLVGFLNPSDLIGRALPGPVTQHLS